MDFTSALEVPETPNVGSSKPTRVDVPLLGSRRAAIATLLLYTCLSAAIFGRQALADIQHVVVGSGQIPIFYGRDQSAYVWFLAWGAHAASHLQNPFLTHAVYAPAGYNLAWAASMLGPSLLLAPLTNLIGAVAMFNVLAIMAPAAAAWGAFLLCRQLTARYSSALAGGLLFGFGTYEAAETVNHLNLALTALLPLAALLLIRRLNGVTSRSRFVLGLGLILGIQLWTSTELLASMGLFALVAFPIACWAGGPRLREVARRIACEMVLAGALALAFGAPYLYYALTSPDPLSGYPATRFGGADLANLVIPTRVTWLNAHSALGGAAGNLAGNVTEQLAYLGPVLLVVMVIFAIEFRRQRLGRFLSAFMLIVLLLSLGNHLVLDGNATGVPLPWNLIRQLPAFTYATPGRFLVYLWLAAALALAIWLERTRFRAGRWLAACLVGVTLLPSLTGLPWGTRVDEPKLMSSSSLSRYVPNGSTVLALPFGSAGGSMFWQVQADFRFRLAGGYVSWALPRLYRELTIIEVLTGHPPHLHIRRRLCAFITKTHTETILLREHTVKDLPGVLATLNIRPVHAGGFAIYRVTPATCST
jgi:hypothetical protein